MTTQPEALLETELLQQKIAGFLGALDARVQAVGAQVEGAQRWKKGLLQQMFV